METSFYDTNIAPAFPRFFGEIQANRDLSPQAKERLQTQVFAGASDINDQRMKLQQDRQNSALNQMRLEQSRLAMEEDAMRRERLRRETERVADLDTRIKEVVGGEGDPLTKSQKLAELELEFGDLSASSTGVSRRFDIARNALPLAPKSLFTPSQQIEQAAKGVPPEVIASGDPIAIGQWMGASAERDAEIQRRAEEVKTQAATSGKVLMDMLTSELEFGDPVEASVNVGGRQTTELRTYLTDAAHARAKFFVESFGTEEEKAAFDAAKSPTDDRPRAAIAERIRVRRLGEIARGAVEGPPRVTGASIVRGR